jgi:hypothetical protein
VSILLLADNKLLLEKELDKSQDDVNTMSKMKNVGKLCRFIVSKGGEKREKGEEKGGVVKIPVRLKQLLIKTH